MVEVGGLEKHKWKLTHRCDCTSFNVSNTEWSIRETITKILICENQQFTSIFSMFPNIAFTSSTSNIRQAILERKTYGVCARFLNTNLFTIPVLIGGKMYCLFKSGQKLVTVEDWSIFCWTPPNCLFCSCKLTPTLFVVKGKLYSLGLLAWTNYEKVIKSKKQRGFVIFGKTGLVTQQTLPVLKDFENLGNTFSSLIGNRKIYHGGYVFTELLKQSLHDVVRYSKIFKGDKLICRMIKYQTKQINSGKIDAVIGKYTVFNMQNSDAVQGSKPKYFNANNIGRYKVVTKMDYTVICKALQLDLMTTSFARRIPMQLKLSDVGYLCLVSSSETSPGISNLELVLGVIISNKEDCMSPDNIKCVLESQLGEVLLPVDKDDNLDEWLFVIINQDIYKHSIFSEKTLNEWVEDLRVLYKNIKPCIEIYQVSYRLYAIYSLELTLYKILTNGLAYSSNEMITSQDHFAKAISENYNLHGPSSLLIPNLNTNHGVRNTLIVHSIKQCLGGKPSPLLHNESYMLKTQPLLTNVPFWCIKTKILLLPLEHNIEDGCVLSSKSVHSKKKFTLRHKLRLSLQIEGVEVLRCLIQEFPILLKPGLVLLKFKAEKVVHMGKHLSLMDDYIEPNLLNLAWFPNRDVIFQKKVILKNITITRTSCCCYCDIDIQYDQNPVPGTKIVILNGAQKSVVTKILPTSQVPRLHRSLNLNEIVPIDVDIIQHPHSLKRLGLNFLFSGDRFNVYNECFDYHPNQKLDYLEKCVDYYISNPETNKFYCDKNGSPIKGLLYEGFVVVMKQNPFALMHAADETTPISYLNNQPEVVYQTSNFLNSNSHPFGISDCERSVMCALGLLHFIEQMHDLCDPTNLILHNKEGESVCIPGSYSLARVLDMLSLFGNEVDFFVNDVETAID